MTKRGRAQREEENQMMILKKEKIVIKGTREERGRL